MELSMIKDEAESGFTMSFYPLFFPTIIPFILNWAKVILRQIFVKNLGIVL